MDRAKLHRRSIGVMVFWSNRKVMCVGWILKYMTFGSVRDVPHWIFSIFAFALPTKLFSTMSFPLDCWPLGTFLLCGLSKCQKAQYSPNEGLECITCLDACTHVESCMGPGSYPSPETVSSHLSEISPLLTRMPSDCGRHV